MDGDPRSCIGESALTNRIELESGTVNVSLLR